MQKTYFIYGSLLAGLAVAVGAFGSHWLKPLLEVNQRSDTFEIAVRYQFYHALALLIMGLMAQQNPDKSFLLAGNLMFAGVIVFSGSLFVLCLTNMRWLGAVTPIGGVLMLVAWALVLWQFVKK
ncbi:MAG: DUF423 domain-containing protein [Verrucomicrobia bacterium]|nr:DUF423 domain-containing protein [Cytophagales bacterium]